MNPSALQYLRDPTDYADSTDVGEDLGSTQLAPDVGIDAGVDLSGATLPDIPAGAGYQEYLKAARALMSAKPTVARPTLTSKDLAKLRLAAVEKLGPAPTTELTREQRGQMLTEFGLRMLAANNHTGPRTTFLQSLSTSGLPTLENYAKLKAQNERDVRQYLADAQAMGDQAQKEALAGYNLDMAPATLEATTRNQNITNLLKMAQASAVGNYKDAVAGRASAQVDALNSGRTLSGGNPNASVDAARVRGAATVTAAGIRGPSGSGGSKAKPLTVNDIEKQITSQANTLMRSFDASPQYLQMTPAQKWAAAQDTARKNLYAQRGKTLVNPKTGKKVVVIDNDPNLVFELK